MPPPTGTVRLPSGACFCIDQAFSFDDVAIVSGWMSQRLALRLPGLLARSSLARADADAAAGHPTVGFVLVLTVVADVAQVDFTVREEGRAWVFPVPIQTEASSACKALTGLLPLLYPMAQHLLRSPSLAKRLAAACVDLPPGLRREVNGFIDEVRTYPSFGMVCYGWAITCVGLPIWLVSDCGTWRPLSEAIRFNRGDIDAAFAADFGSYTAEAGFFCALQGRFSTSTGFRLVVMSPAGLYTLAGRTGVEGSRDPMTYARWAFALPTPSSRFNDRLEHHDGALLELLIAQQRRAAPAEAVCWRTGPAPAAPAVSVIVPLYGRMDFIEHQLQEFCEDADFSSGRVELIYVVDDPRLVEPVRTVSDILFRLYGVPFCVVWGGINRGYSGANNLGVRYARGDTVVLLNSDVFPTQPGWCGRMAKVLSDRLGICAVGARLEYGDGSLQHHGMAFWYCDELSIWLNRHPGQGTEQPRQPGRLREVPAATGACLAIRRVDLQAVGGLDEQFLMGDFEDSDLCMRLSAQGGQVVVLGDTCLVHLERQSFGMTGDPGFRTSVTRYNGWRHSRRWHERLAVLSGGTAAASEGASASAHDLASVAPCNTAAPSSGLASALANYSAPGRTSGLGAVSGSSLAGGLSSGVALRPESSPVSGLSPGLASGSAAGITSGPLQGLAPPSPARYATSLASGTPHGPVKTTSAADGVAA